MDGAGKDGGGCGIAVGGVPIDQGVGLYLCFFLSLFLRSFVHLFQRWDGHDRS